MNGYLKSKLNNFRIILLYYLVILILTIFATYKNGIILYQKNLINIIQIFKPLLLVITSIIVTYIINYIYYNIIKKDNYNIKDDYTPVFIGLISLTLPLNINVFLYMIIIILANIAKFYYKLDNINYYNLIKILFIIILITIGKYSYLTIYDNLIETNFNTFDLFIGRGYGGIGISNIFLLLICYLIMFFNKAYKKDIPLIAFVSYIISLILFDLIFKNSIIIDIKYLLTNAFIFGIIFIATIPIYSPIKHKEIILYSCLIGILSFLINKIFNLYDSVFIAIFFANLVIICYKKLERMILNEHK